MTASNGAGEGHGASVRRVEDPPFLRGTRPYTDDLREPGALYAVFVRSGFAHAKITGIDTSEAAAAPGVVGVYTAADLDLKPFAHRRPAGRHAGGDAPAGAGHGQVRFIGEPVAVRRGRDARAGRRRRGARRRRLRPARRARRHDQGARRRRAEAVRRCGNLAAAGPEGEDALADAEVRVGGRFINQRLAAVPMEPSARAGRARPGDGRLHPLDAEPGPARLPGRDLRLDRASRTDKLRVVSTATGGGFGARIACYPEQIVVVALARELGRAVRYVETRSETMLEMQHGRAQVQDVEIGGTRDGKVTGLKVRVIADCGAYPADAALMPMLTGLMSCGVYDVPEGRLPLRRGRDQHDADRRLPRRRAARRRRRWSSARSTCSRPRSAWTRPRSGARTSSPSSRTRR